MTYMDFQNKILNDLSNIFKDTADVSIHKIPKNNDILLDGLTILEKGNNIAPTIYLNYYYHEILEGKDYDTVLTLLISDYNKHKPDQNINLKFFTDFEQIKPRIVYKLVNQKRNEQLLQEIPFIPYMDLAIVFYCILSTQENTRATFLIYNHHLPIWNTTKEELYQIATENTPQLLASEINNLQVVLQKIIDTESPDAPPLTIDKKGLSMHILTNSSKQNGACCILYPGVLEKFANETACDLFILPSSVHEVILLPARDKKNVLSLNEMVKDVNTTHLSEDEILADHIYYYSRASKTLSM